MPRPLSGRIIERRLHDERLAFDVVIRRRQVLVGYSPEWTRQRVAFLLSDQLLPRAKLREPWWEAIPSAQESESPAEPGVVSLREAASEYVGRLRSQYTNRATLNAYTSPVMKHVGPFFSYDCERERRVDEISGALVSSFTATKIAERDLLTNLAATLAELDDEALGDPARLRAQLDSEAEWELLVRYGQRRGRLPLAEALGPEDTGRISLSSRGLSNNEINRCLARLRDIIELAREEFGAQIGDPTRKRSLPRTDPPGSWLLPFQLQAVFDAADELDDRRSAGPDYRSLGRRALVELLALAGPRVSEVGRGRWGGLHLDGDSPFFRIREAKTTAGRRDLRLHPMVCATLRARREALDPAGDAYIFATATGGRRDRHSIRTRLLEPVVNQAAELLERRSLPCLPQRVTAHTFRRTYLTYLAWAGVPMRRAMSQAGHKDAKLTLQIYQQDFPDSDAGLAQIQTWLGLDSGPVA
jgi:integrase